MASRGAVPAGTDGSDFSYRQTIEDRYSRIAAIKERVSTLFVAQLLVVAAFAAVARSPAGVWSSVSGSGSILALAVAVGGPLIGTLYVRAPVQKRHTVMLYAYIIACAITAITAIVIVASNAASISGAALTVCVIGLGLSAAHIYSGITLVRLTSESNRKPK